MADAPKHLLIVEDEAPLRKAIAEQLSDHGYRVEQAESGEIALAKLADFAFDIIITDLRLPGVDGSAVVEAAVGRYPHIIAIVVTGYGTVKDAVEAIKRGAFDFVSKPCQIDELLHVLDSALEQRRLKSENAYLRAQLEQRYRFEEIIGKSQPMVRLFQLLETVAPTNSTILITGDRLRCWRGRWDIRWRRKLRSGSGYGKGARCGKCADTAADPQSEEEPLDDRGR
jgi:DNA-binding NtrC family response regulator